MFLIKKIFAFSGRRYGYGKRKIKKDILPIPHKRLPLCSGGCTRQFIAPECREETFGFEHGMECRGCPIDICKGQLPIGGGHVGLDRGFINQRLNGGFMDSFQNRDFLNQGQGRRFKKKFRNGFKKRQKQRYDD